MRSWSFGPVGLGFSGVLGGGLAAWGSVRRFFGGGPGAAWLAFLCRTFGIAMNFFVAESAVARLVIGVGTGTEVSGDPRGLC